VSASDLSSIKGLEDKHLRVLARHGVTDLRGLAQADREVIYRATANLRPGRPVT
jgi:predicted flap endonuclease-1-like 5' DNA nuclease